MHTQQVDQTVLVKNIGSLEEFENKQILEEGIAIQSQFGTASAVEFLKRRGIQSKLIRRMLESSSRR